MGEVGATAEPPFPSIAIVGLGLIGGSIALAVGERWPASRVFGVDAEPVLAHALGAGATKRDIVNAARALPPAVSFVGGHPLGGGERGGFAFARPDLFAGRPWIFTPDGDDSGDAVERLSRFVTGLGASPRILSAEEHDRVMAYVSHLPQ